jgi:hypothetical protein
MSRSLRPPRPLHALPCGAWLATLLRRALPPNSFGGRPRLLVCSIAPEFIRGRPRADTGPAPVAIPWKIANECAPAPTRNSRSDGRRRGRTRRRCAPRVADSNRSCCPSRSTSTVAPSDGTRPATNVYPTAPVAATRTLRKSDNPRALEWRLDGASSHGSQTAGACNECMRMGAVNGGASRSRRPDAGDRSPAPTRSRSRDGRSRRRRSLTTAAERLSPPSSESLPVRQHPQSRESFRARLPGTCGERPTDPRLRRRTRPRRQTRSRLVPTPICALRARTLRRRRDPNMRTHNCRGSPRRTSTPSCSSIRSRRRASRTSRSWARLRAGGCSWCTLDRTPRWARAEVVRRSDR